MRILALLLTLVAAGCAHNPQRSARVEPVCTALIGPISYNSRERASRRYAGPDLVPDLKQRNQVGQGLGCPQYR